MLYGLVFDYAFVHAHDLIRTTWSRRIWIHALQPDRTMKQEIHLWNTALAPDASHHAHAPSRTAWCRWFFDCILHGCRRLIPLQNMTHATVDVLISAVFESMAHCASWHIMHTTSSAKCCMHASCTFRCIGTHHIILVFHTQNMMMTVLWFYLSSQI